MSKPLFEAIVGSKAKLGINSSDVDLRGFYIPTTEDLFNPLKPSYPKFEWRYKEKIGDVIYDRDLWDLSFAIRQIVRGDNSSPLLLSCLFVPEYHYKHDAAEELIVNRHKLISENMLKGTLKFTEQKIRTSKRPNSKHSQGKYIYYALSDLIESYYILKNGECEYPLVTKHYDLLLDLKNNEAVEAGYKAYEELKKEFLSLKVKEKVDVEFIKNYCIKTYKEFINET